jgi:hypothetical protein
MSRRAKRNRDRAGPDGYPSGNTTEPGGAARTGPVEQPGTGPGLTMLLEDP